MVVMKHWHEIPLENKWRNGVEDDNIFIEPIIPAPTCHIVYTKREYITLLKYTKNNSYEIL